jgi:hypothetical protein
MQLRWELHLFNHSVIVLRVFIKLMPRRDHFEHLLSPLSFLFKEAISSTLVIKIIVFDSIERLRFFKHIL